MDTGGQDYRYKIQKKGNGRCAAVNECIQVRYCCCLFLQLEPKAGRALVAPLSNHPVHSRSLHHTAALSPCHTAYSQRPRNGHCRARVSSVPVQPKTAPGTLVSPVLWPESFAQRLLLVLG